MANANIELIREIVAGERPRGRLASRTSGPAWRPRAGAMPPPDTVTIETDHDRRSSGRVGRARRRWPPTRVVLYLHGGGYCIGSIATHRNLVSRLALAFGGRVLNLDYRLAPEHPFPAAVDDAVGGLPRAARRRASRRRRIAIAGDSAGGGLTRGVAGRHPPAGPAPAGAPASACRPGST